MLGVGTGAALQALILFLLYITVNTRAWLACSFWKFFKFLCKCIFSWRIQYCIGFCHISTWTLPLEPLSHLSPHPTPLGYHREQDLNSLQNIGNSHWLSISHMVTYMFQCFSLISSYPLLPSLCPQVCSLCLCLHCCPANSVALH